MARRKIALLGGTTNAGDCFAGLRVLAAPQRLLSGPAIEAYERAFAERSGARHAVSFAAGRIALYDILRALGIGESDEVLLQVPTHVVVPNAIRYTGATPVYVDCRLDDFNIDLEQAERQLTRATKALVLQHTFGVPADIDGALALARGHGLHLIEDCVHALGATYRGRPVGSFGRASFFSTEETKTISTTMGGMATTDDDELAGALRRYQSGTPWPPRGLVMRYVIKLGAYHVLTQPHVHRYSRAVYERAGERHPLPKPTSEDELRGLRPERYEQRLSNAQAVLGLRQLARLDANLAHRASCASAYAEILRGHGVEPPPEPPGAQASWVRYPVWVRDRPEAVERLRAHAVPGTWFTSVLEEADAPGVAGYETGACPRAEAAATHLVNLPTHPRVRSDDVQAIGAAVAGLAVPVEQREAAAAAATR